ncbi:MAG: Asp23/Gls24 family envelope stress response protein [Lachnospiraceae bacterium]|nr:Asp23/Gls24 family envelope stress response protein [Lachnospiraceae bacterium]
MNGSINTALGEVVINKEVIEKCAGAAAVECFGIVGMASINMRDGLAKLLKRENLRDGVKAKIDDEKITIDLHIIVTYEVNIPSVCHTLRETVKYKVEELVGLKVERVNIYVEGIRVID